MSRSHVLLSILVGNVLSTTALAADYNNDGYRDLAVGVLGESSDAGAVQVLYGSATGISNDDDLWRQGNGGILGTSSAGDGFGNALASGDFDDDGYTDLAVGVPNDAGSPNGGGLVHIIYGGVGGLSAVGDEQWDQNDLGGSSDAFDRFGAALAAGDFNGDGVADLAIGTPWENEVATFAGRVYVMYGQAGLGLDNSGAEYFDQDAGGVGIVESWDIFGSALAAGDINGDGRVDLVIGAPSERDDATGIGYAGAITTVYGSVTGLDENTAEYWTQDSPDVDGAVEEQDRFGTTMTTCDIDNDGYKDVIIGVPDEDDNTLAGAGKVWVGHGGSGGIDLTTDILFGQSRSGILGTEEVDDNFGEAIDCADFNGDGYADLAVGAPGQVVNAMAEAGYVAIIYSNGTALSTAGDQQWMQDSAGIVNTSEAYDWFGSALTAGDYDNDGDADLAVGVCGETIAAATDNGAVHVLYGTAAGISATGDKVWEQDSANILGVAEVDDCFGGTLR